MQKETPREIAGEDFTLDSGDVVRRLIVAQNPEFTPSWREPAPVNQNTSDDFLNRGDIELLELNGLNQSVRCAGCQLKHRPGALWFGNFKKLMPNVADNAKEKVQSTQLQNREASHFFCSSCFSCGLRKEA